MNWFNCKMRMSQAATYLKTEKACIFIKTVNRVNARGEMPGMHVEEGAPCPTNHRERSINQFWLMNS